MYLVSDNIPIWVAVLVGAFATALVWFATSISRDCRERRICRGIVVIFIWPIMIWASLYPSFWMKYEVTIDNNVSCVEFFNNYGTNITREGEKYTIIGKTHHDWLWNMKEYENAELGKLSER